MFRLIYLKLKNHPQLGDIDLHFSDASELEVTSKPYSSIIIGANGTGKSYILREVAEIFRHFKSYSLDSKKDFYFNFNFDLRYAFFGNVYEIVTDRFQFIGKDGRPMRNYLYFKNRPLEANYSNSYPLPLTVKETEFKIGLTDLEFPEKLIVNSQMSNDRFIFQKSNVNDFYQYLGIRSTSSTTSTKSSARRTINNLFNARISNNEFINALKDLLKFLVYEESFKVSYITRINRLFFSGNLTLENFKRNFESWWEEDFQYSSRKQENPSWSIPYYNNNFKDNNEKIQELVNYLNFISSESKWLQKKAKSSSKLAVIDLLSTEFTENDFKMFRHLESLDIINLSGINLKKVNSNLKMDELSSGEYHLFMSLVSIFANISKASLVLIDEPEISLHPNWQMRYVSFLKEIFSKFNDSHFILTTHSHFLVSDLEGESSSITALKRDSSTNKLSAEILYGLDTFGWSAENVLLNVFEVATTRNFYIAERLSEIFRVASKSVNPDLNIYKEELFRWYRQLKENDPLHYTIEKLIYRMKWLD